MPTLAGNVGKTVKQLSWAFVTRSCGLFIGGILPSLLEKRIQQITILIICSFSIILNLVFTPTVSNWIGLIILIFILGVNQGESPNKTHQIVLYLGAVDSSGQTLILNLFNSDQSPIFIAFFHFIWNIGGVLALILLSGVVEPEVEQPCPNIDFMNNTNRNSRAIENAEFNNLTFLYWSFAGITLPIGIYIYYLYASEHIEKIKALNGIADSSDPDLISFAYKEKFRRVRGYAAVLVIFMFGFGFNTALSYLIRTEVKI